MSTPSNGATPALHAEYHRSYYHRNKEKAQARMKAYREANPKAIWATLIKRKYGLTVDQYEDMYQVNGGACQLCAHPLNPPLSGLDKANDACVDHCHSTGKVRGLLCHKCNRALGLFCDSPAVLRRAAAYLENI